MDEVKIPLHAKMKAWQALKKRKALPRREQYGLSSDEARELGINSGVERAKQIVNNDYLPLSEAKRVAAFYQRFKGCRTPKCEGALDLWGGRRWGKELVNKLRKER